MAETCWSCGCYEVDGELTRECTQTRPVGELSAAHPAKPFSVKCHRKAKLAHDAVEAKANSEAAQQEAKLAHDAVEAKANSEAAQQE